MARSKGKIRPWLRLLKETFSDFGQDSCPRLAAALSYYTIFSLPPLLLLLLLLLGTVLEPSDVHKLLTGQLGSLLGPGGADEIRNILEQSEQPDLTRGWAAILGLGALLFGAVGSFVELQSALNRIWEVQPDPRRGGVRRFLLQRVVSFGMVLTIAFLLLVALVISALLAAFGDVLGRLIPGTASDVILRVIDAVISFAGVSFLFALLFRYVPDARAAWRDVGVGAVATALLFTLGKVGLGIYVARSDPGSSFGAAGALAVLLVWIYYSAIILFLGAEFTQAWARQRGAGIEPEPGAVPLRD